MVHGDLEGQGSAKKKSGCGTDTDFQVFLARPGLDFDSISALFSGFQPQATKFVKARPETDLEP